MEILFAFLFGLLILATLILPWVNTIRIRTLREDIEHLQTIIAQLSSKLAQNDAVSEPVNSQQTAETPVPAAESMHASFPAAKSEPIVKLAPLPVKPTPKQEKTKKTATSFEQQFASRLPVWTGGIALALAGFFLVKYSIEHDLLNPTVRVIAGALLGLALLYTAHWIQQRKTLANGKRISQSLAGAGIAVLYLVSFAASRLYQLIPEFGGFLAMAAVTATAVVLALRHGPPIAVLGMAGGFLTPALLGTSVNAVTLFTYVYFTATGLLFVIRRSNWWWLSLPTITAAFLWVIYWLLNLYSPGDSLWLGLFLLAISMTMVVNSRQQYARELQDDKQPVFKMTTLLNYLGLSGALILMGMVAAKAEFGMLEWGLFALLALASIGLAYFNDTLYGFVPWVSMAVNAVMLMVWSSTDGAFFALILAIYAGIYVISAYVLILKGRQALSWGGLCCTTALLYYLLAYYKLPADAHTGIPFFWGLLAFLLAGLTCYVLLQVQSHFQGYRYQQHLLAVFAGAATAFVALGFFIELDREFFSVTIAAEMLGVALINRYSSIKALRSITAALGILFAVLLLPQILLMIQLTIYSLVEARLHLQSSVPIVQWPLFQLGLPALMFMLSGYFLKQQKDDTLVQSFEISAISLIAVMGYYFTRNSFHSNENVLFIQAGFFERGVISNILFVYGLLCLWVGRCFRRMAVSWSGIVLSAVVLFRITYFDLFIHNPLWDTQTIAGWPLLNALLLPYALPIIWCSLAARELDILGKTSWTSYIRGFQLVLFFVLITLNVRFWFHGENLRSGMTGNVEIYCYSVIWLLFGIGLLCAGILQRHKMLRYAALLVMLLSVAKVFLFDAAELEGLYRVFSFLGLGICLIGLSYIYTKYVFGNDYSDVSESH